MRAKSPSKREYSEAGNTLEVAEVERGDVEAKMKRRCPDHEVLEVDHDAIGRLLTLNRTGELGNLERDGMHDQNAEGFLGEKTSPCAVSIGSGPVYAVREFDDGDS